MLRSGRGALHQPGPVEEFPVSLLLNEVDAQLYGRVSEQLVLAETNIGQHRVELLLWAFGPDSVGLGLRIPTAANQYKEPYLLLEAEAGNSAADAVREINFHLVGRVDEEQIQRVNWRAFFRDAALKLDALR
ncbi:MAG: hypothetical protein ACT4TC_07850, partial [Myxococcaceae bacterium]